MSAIAFTSGSGYVDTPIVTITGGSGCVAGGDNGSNIVIATATSLTFTGGNNSSNITSTIGNGQYTLYGATNAFNQFTLDGGCNYIVGATNATNIYIVDDPGSGIIIYGAASATTTNTVVPQNGAALSDYCVVTNPTPWGCLSFNGCGYSWNRCGR